MIADFSVLFSINRATSTYSIVLTDTSTDVTDIKGNFKITFPDGSVYHNTNFTSPDISAPGGSATIIAKTQSSDGEVMRGAYEIIYTALDVDDDIVDGNTKTFNFSFDEPNLVITNISDVALPSVGFSCDTDITSTDYTGVISTFSISSSFPSTSDVSSETATQDLTVSRDLDQVFASNYYEGLYNPVVDLTVAYTSVTYAYLTVQFIDQVTSAFNIYAVQTASELLTLIETFKAQESADKNPYNRAMALYSNIESSAREGVAVEGNNLLSELLSILNVSNVHAFQSGPILGLNLIYAESNDLTSVVTWANVPDANITESSVTQHEGALSITESQISDLGGYLTSESNDLTAAVTWANVPDANITESSVTQHEGALDHDSLANYVANEHIDWTSTTEDLETTGIGSFGLIEIEDDVEAGGNVEAGGYLQLAEQATPATPVSGTGRLYPKADGKWYTLDDAGTEAELGAGVDLGNIDISGNTISSTDTNGNINFVTDGTGKYQFGSSPYTLGTYNFGSGDISVRSGTRLYWGNSGTSYIHGNNTHGQESLLFGVNGGARLGLVQTGTGTLDHLIIGESMEIGWASTTNINYSSTQDTSLSRTEAGVVRIDDIIEIAEVATPSTPSSGYGRIYFKSDGLPYALNDAGTEMDLFTTDVVRVQTSTGGSTTITSDTVDELNAYGLISTLTLPNPSGTPTEGQSLLIKIRDNGTSRTVTWSGGQWRAFTGVTLPTTTTINKTIWVLALWNGNDSNWDVLSVKEQA